jgi:hypothetical protein
VRKNKYGNRKTTRIVDGKPVVFDSEHEAQRYFELRILQRAGKIRKLDRQVWFTLIPMQKDENGKTIEQSAKYCADFTYYERHEKSGSGWRYVVEDAKGMRTQSYILKRKLMLYTHGIRIREV